MRKADIEHLDTFVRWAEPHGSNRRAVLWCDGAVRSMLAHPRIEYEQFANAVGQRVGCPLCRPASRPGVVQLGTVPGVAERLVDPLDAVLSCGSEQPVQLWCDGTVQGNPAHERVTYTRLALSVPTSNTCPLCTVRYGTERLGDDPGRRARLVHPERDARLRATSRTPVEVWCNGVVAGHVRHERLVYTQTPMSLRRGQNGCPACGGLHNARRPLRDDPVASQRLVDPLDGRIGVHSSAPVEVWCNGLSSNRPRHRRTTYTQSAKSLTQGVVSCPVCRHGAHLGDIEWLGRRLLDAADREMPTFAAAFPHVTVRLWCDGRANNRPSHQRIAYRQQADRAVAGANDCPLCTGRKTP